MLTLNSGRQTAQSYTCLLRSKFYYHQWGLLPGKCRWNCSLLLLPPNPTLFATPELAATVMELILHAVMGLLIIGIPVQRSKKLFY